MNRRIAVILNGVKDLGILCGMVLLVSSPIRAQVSTGTPPLGSFSGGPDIINNANLNVHLVAPVLVKAGRGLPFSYVLSYDSSVWYPVTSGSTQVWTAVLNWGWRGVTEIATGYVSDHTSVVTCRYIDPSTGLLAFSSYAIYSQWAYHDPFGVSHGFNIATTLGSVDCGVDPVTTASATANDGSGYSISITNTTSATVFGRSGETINAPVGGSSGAGTATDTNGNLITASSSASTTTFTDTLGTAAMTVSAPAPGPTAPTTFTYTNAAGTSSTVTMNYTAQTVKTNFGCAGISEYGPTTQNLVTSISLPDGTFYSITYEATPGFAGDVTGRIASVKLPAGGTIFYTYSGGSNGITCANGSAATLTRTVSPGGTWTYAHTESGTAWTTTLTDPNGKITTLHFQGIYETSRTLPDALGSVTTCYNGNLANCDATAVALPITRRTVTTTLV